MRVVFIALFSDHSSIRPLLLPARRFKRTIRCRLLSATLSSIHFGTASGTGVEMDTSGPAIEFNWGVIPNVQLHVVIPAAGIIPSNNAVYFPSGAGPNAFGMGDTEVRNQVPVHSRNQAPAHGRHFPDARDTQGRLA